MKKRIGVVMVMIALVFAVAFTDDHVHEVPEHTHTTQLYIVDVGTAISLQRQINELTQRVEELEQKVDPSLIKFKDCGRGHSKVGLITRFEFESVTLDKSEWKYRDEDLALDVYIRPRNKFVLADGRAHRDVPFVFQSFVGNEYISGAREGNWQSVNLIELSDGVLDADFNCEAQKSVNNFVWSIERYQQDFENGRLTGDEYAQARSYIIPRIERVLNWYNRVKEERNSE